MTVRVLTGDCRDVLCTLPDESVHCVVTSPPYWGLRDYGTAKWEGGDSECAHVGKRSVGASTLMNDGRAVIGLQPDHKYATVDVPYRDICGKCGARRIDNQIGLEGSFHGYIEAMRKVFAEVWRVLRKDGTLWLNLGDSYAANGISGLNVKGYTSTLVGSANSEHWAGNKSVPAGLKPKDLCGIPWRVALALQADGWYLRSDIIWSKPNPMPESVTDRPTKAHEYLFLMSKSERYFYDAEAIAEKSTGANTHGTNATSIPGRNDQGNDLARIWGSEKRNRRTVWEIATSPYSEAHFATFPPALVEPCIKAGTSEKGCCAKCGAPWVREVEQIDRGGKRIGDTLTEGATRNRLGGQKEWDRYTPAKTIGFSPSCSCNSGTVPGTVLDPFGGAGTTGLVADRLGRNAILIELNPDYAAMADRRLRQDAGMFAHVAAE